MQEITEGARCAASCGLSTPLSQQPPVPKSFSASVSRERKTETRSRPPPTPTVLTRTDPEGDGAREDQPGSWSVIRDPLSVWSRHVPVRPEVKIDGFPVIVRGAVFKTFPSVFYDRNQQWTMEECDSISVIISSYYQVINFTQVTFVHLEGLTCQVPEELWRLIHHLHCSGPKSGNTA